MEQQAAAAAASSSSSSSVPTETCVDTTEYWSIFTVDNVKCAVKLEGSQRLIWRPYSSSFKSTPPPVLDGTNKSDVTLPMDDICIVSALGNAKFALHCLVVNDKVQPLSRVYEKHEFAFVSRLGELPVPVVTEKKGEDCGWMEHIKGIVDECNGHPSQRNPVFVYINPYSGTKKSVYIWENECIPLLKDAGLSFEEHKTEFAGDAMDRVGKLQLDKYSAIATVGGDGILSEIINGLMNRSDWETAIKTPLAPIPGGTGNATSYSLYYNITATCAICHLVKGRSRRSDLFLASQPTVGKYIWGFLSCNYGIVAESDFGSEKIRWAGSLRPSIWAVYRIMCGTSYKCKVTYLPTEVPRQDWYNVKCVRGCPHCKNALAQLTNDYVADHSHRSFDSDDEDSDASESSSNSSSQSGKSDDSYGSEDSFDSGGNGDDERSASSSSATPSTSNLNNASPDDDDYNMTDATAKRTATSSTSTQPIVSSSSSSSSSTFSEKKPSKDEENGEKDEGEGEDDGSSLPELPQPKEIDSENAGADTLPNASNVNGTQQIEDVSYGPQYTTSMSSCAEWSGDIPARFSSLFSGYEHYQIGGSVPSGWAVQERMELNWVSIQKMPWLMTGMHTAPYAHMVDGCMDITYATNEGFTRMSFLKLFMQFSDGSFLNSPKLSYLKVRSFTLEPLDEMGYVGIDGERIPFAPISVHVAQAITNFVCFV